MGIGAELVALSEWAIERTQRRLDGLGDDELRWQPAPGSWTVRRLRDGRVVVDNRLGPGPDVPPPSIAWRLAHLIDIYGSPRNAKWLGVPAELLARAPSRSPWPIAERADDARALLQGATDHWLEMLRAVGDDDWWEPLGPGCEPWHESTLVAFAHHQLDEAIHHGAEVGLLRDLFPYRTAEGAEEAPVDDVARAAELGRWDVVEALVLDGHPVGVGDGTTPLHQAAAVGDLPIVRLLVDAGASLDVEDPVFHGTPEVWARYFGHHDLADQLEELRHR